MSQSLMQKVLGADWLELPIAIQRHYQISNGQSSYLQGDMEIHYPKYLFPLIWLIHLFGGLVLWPGKAVKVEVRKHANPENRLNWRRTITYSDGRVDYFSSHMHYAADHELAEMIGFGFGLSLQVEVCDGDLIYRSNGHFWQCGKIKITLPDWLLLGSALIREHALADERFYLDFTIRHPLWGLTYCYRGEFRYP